MLCFIISCKKNGNISENGAFKHEEPKQTNSGYDLPDIEASGELIAATLSGPDTYFDYQGQPMGLQYALAANFANREGIRVRIETAHDTLELIKMLQSGEVDLIALPISVARLKKENIRPTGATDKYRKYSWSVRNNSPLLAEALKEWYEDNPLIKVENQEKQRLQSRHHVQRKVRAPYISQEKGIISSYDNYFKQASYKTGWDWKLIAAQCYQESGFDPTAISWAGARGLMQIMPQTAKSLGISPNELYSPETNIETAAQYIKKLSGHFNDIKSQEEKTKFILAAYNGGQGHIRDAMNLAKKYGHKANIWEEVAPFVKKLSIAKYYRDPVVKYGYMIGDETYSYVEKVVERYHAYGGRSLMANSTSNSIPQDRERPAHKNNRFSKEHKIYTPEEMMTNGF